MLKLEHFIFCSGKPPKNSTISSRDNFIASTTFLSLTISVIADVEAIQAPQQKALNLMSVMVFLSGDNLIHNLTTSPQTGFPPSAFVSKSFNSPIFLGLEK